MIDERQHFPIYQIKLVQIKAGAKQGEIVAQLATISRTQFQVKYEQTTQRKAIELIKAQY